MKPITIVIADDHHFLRTAWKIILENDPRFQVLAHVGTGEEAAAAVINHEPDVVLMDVAMPVMDGIKATRIVSSLMPQVKVLGISASTDPVQVRHFLDAGAAGYVSKYARAQELKDALIATMEGKRWICDHVQRQFMEVLPDMGATRRVRPLLTRREMAIAQLMKQGADSNHISRQLGISQRTVAVHKSNIYRKLGFRNNPQLAATLPALN